jgi:predicted amidohydrolase YtcJ
MKTVFLVAVLLAMRLTAFTQEPAPELILHSGKIVTVDSKFSIQEAIAIRGGRVVAVGSNQAIRKLKQTGTEEKNLQGGMVLPGLIDSHVHPDAAMTEFDHPIPTMESIDDVLSYVRSRAALLEPGKWVTVRQVFITRLREQRYPTRAELDAAAPMHPVLFATGPDASLNSLALKLSGIDKDFQITDGGSGRIEKDPKTGEPTGILRNCTRFVKVTSSGRTASEADTYGRTLELFRDYNSVGLTAVCNRNADPSSIRLYERMLAAGELPVRMMLSHQMGTLGPIETVQERIREVARHPLRKENPMLRIIGIKTFLDGGMLTGSAYMREPWGVSDIYSITDPQYRGVLFIPAERLNAIVGTAVEAGLQFTAHSVGDGAVHALLDAYEETNRKRPIRETRPCITHCNFMSKEAIEKMASLGVIADIQPAWLYLDTRTLTKQFGYDRLRYFQPLRTIFEKGVIAGGGSDHMQKIGSLRAINPYNPFLGMATAVTRKARWYEGTLHPEEGLSRRQAIEFYTRNNAYLLFLEQQIGSLEVGKFADLILLDRDILTCPDEEIQKTEVRETYLAGKRIYKAE